MKKIWKYGVLLALPLVLAGCGNKPTEGSNKNKEITSIKWTVDGELEAQKGQNKNIGTAGLLYGKTKDYIVVGGGANFPEEPVAKGGAKKLYPDIYVLKNENGSLKQ
ncbi:MAG: cyclically-permuted mutarotase family protein, partial [Clostridium perfringens]|nr:cyclically-permuted mutarotase family protein [Clostridium perfringens]